MTGQTPAPHSSATVGESSAMPLALTHAATQRGAIAAKSRMSLFRITIRSGMERATQASFWACRVCNAASISSCEVDWMLPETVGNWGEPCRVSMAIAGNLLYQKLYRMRGNLRLPGLRSIARRCAKHTTSVWLWQSSLSQKLLQHPDIHRCATDPRQPLWQSSSPPLPSGLTLHPFAPGEFC